MGRMDEALRRAGIDLGRPLAAVSSQAAFVAPWTTAAEATARVPEVADPPPALAPPRPTIVREREFASDAEGRLRRAFNPDCIHRLVIASQPNVALVEQFRGLAALLHRARAAAEPHSSFRMVMVTSAEPNEGKTLTSANLALTLSESYRQRVLLIDADLRRPSLRMLCHLADGPGLSEGLKAAHEQKLKAVPVSDTLTLLPAGRPDPDPMSSLTSKRMDRILEEAAAGFDWVIIDAPPCGPIADAGLIAGMVDVVLLVIRAEQTKCAAVQKAIETVGRERILGVVLNAAAADGEDAGYGGYYGPRQP
jgi:protein-tyrosine kinase